MLSRTKMRQIVNRKEIRKKAVQIINTDLKHFFTPGLSAVAKAIVNQADKIHSSGADVIVAPLTGADLICKMTQRVIEKKYPGKKIPVVEWDKVSEISSRDKHVIKNVQRIFVLDDAYRPPLSAEDLSEVYKKGSGSHPTRDKVIKSIYDLNPTAKLDYNYLSADKSISLSYANNPPVPPNVRGFTYFLEVSPNKNDYKRYDYSVKYNVGVLRQLIHQAKTDAERKRLTEQLKDELILLEAHKEYKRRLQREVDKLLTANHK